MPEDETGRLFTLIRLNCLELIKRSESDLADATEIDVLSGLPKVVVVLHGKPTLGRTAESFGKTQGHFRANSVRTSQNAAEGRRGNSELHSKLAATNVVWLKIYIRDEFAGMWWIVHCH
jgi:hypothetical protein